MFLPRSGVYLSLNGVTIPDDGHVLVTDIGEENAGLHCNTDRTDCCRSSDGVAQGEWYRPDGSRVLSFTDEIANNPTRNFFSRNRGTRVVRLNRAGTPPERGRFRCEVPNAAGDLVTVFVNIGEWFAPSLTVLLWYYTDLCFILL